MPTGSASPLGGACILITGASSGIGLGVAKGLAEAGAAVALNYNRHADSAEDLARHIRAQGGRAIALGGDVGQEDDVRRLFADAVREFGRLDALVANSGLQKDARIGEMTLQDWRTVIDINLTGQFLCCREAIRVFRGQSGAPFRARGSIVCMSSVHEIIPWAGHVNYAASKGGIHMMMQSLAQEVAPERIRVNAVAPGAIRTPINKEGWETPDALRKLLTLIPYGRIGEAEDIANAVAFLLSDKADYITGATLFVDGGMSLYPGFADNG